MCDSGFQFENGASSAMVDCDLFEGKKSADIPKCVRIGKALLWSFFVVGGALRTSQLFFVVWVNQC